MKKANWYDIYQKRVMRTKLDIHVFITITESIPLLIIQQVVSVLALSWLIRYTYYWNLQFLNNLIINHTKVIFTQALVTLANFGYTVDAPWSTCFPRTFNLFGFPIFWSIWAYLMKAILEMGLFENKSNPVIWVVFILGVSCCQFVDWFNCLISRC